MKTDQMLGIVLCAGLGTRLRPLTHVLPKPAVPVGPVPAALRNIEQLLTAGFDVVHCNTHYLTQTLTHELQAACTARGISQSRLRFWHEDELLETGGGIARIVRAVAAESGQSNLQDTLVVSGDIVADIPLSSMTAAWSERTHDETTLMVSLPIDKPRKDVTWVDRMAERVCGFGADLEASDAASRGIEARVFSNHQIISGRVLERAAIEKRSSIDLFYRDALRRGERILHIPYPEHGTWFDIGTPETYLRCLSKLNPHLPDQLSCISLGKVELCLPHQALHSTGSTNNTQDHNCLNWNKFAEDCISKTDQGTPWLWLGHLHVLPEALLSGLVNLISAMRKPPEPCTQRVHSDLFSVGFSSSSRPAGFLAPGGTSLAFGHSPLSLPCEAFMDAALPSTLSSNLTLTAPLLVPFDLLLALAPGTSHIVLEARSPFWLLVTQPQL